MFRRTMCAFLALFLIAGLLPLYALAEGGSTEETARIEEAEVPEEALPEARTVIANGRCGRNLTWTLYDTGVLTITGLGAMYDFEWLSAPWYPLRDSIHSVVVKKGVSGIGMCAFLYCENITKVTITDTVTAIGDYAFGYCRSLTTVTIPEGVTSIGSSAFCGCSSLTSVTIPEGVDSIGKYTFYGCSSLTSVTIPGSVKTIGSYAFSDCSSLAAVSIPEGVTSIGMSAFWGCSSLTSVTIPAGVTSIREYTFYGCSRLNNVTIPDSVTSIAEYAFYNCNALKDVYYDGTQADWEKIGIGSDNTPLLSAALHCREGAPVVSFVKGPNGEMLYYEDGKPVPSKYGFVDYNGSKFLVANGRIVTTKSGLARDPEHPEDWYFLSHGQVQTQHTGLTQYDGEWFYVENGKLDTTLTAVVEYDGGLFLVARGRLLVDKIGLGQDPVTHIWYLFSHGQVQTQYTGLFQYDGKWFYVQKGVFDSTFNGEITFRSRRYLIRNGTLVREIV